MCWCQTRAPLACALNQQLSPTLQRLTPTTSRWGLKVQTRLQQLSLAAVPWACCALEVVCVLQSGQVRSAGTAQLVCHLVGGVGQAPGIAAKRAPAYAYASCVCLHRQIKPRIAEAWMLACTHNCHFLSHMSQQALQHPMCACFILPQRLCCAWAHHLAVITQPCLDHMPCPALCFCHVWCPAEDKVQQPRPVHPDPCRADPVLHDRCGKSLHRGLGHTAKGEACTGWWSSTRIVGVFGQTAQAMHRDVAHTAKTAVRSNTAGPNVASYCNKAHICAACATA
jgi:hypothetical protein